MYSGYLEFLYWLVPLDIAKELDRRTNPYKWQEGDSKKILPPFLLTLCPVKSVQIISDSKIYSLYK